MGDFRLEDLGAIIQGLVIVGALLFGGMAVIALWPKIMTASRLFFRVGAWRLTPSLSTLADDLRERALRRRRVRAFRAAVLIGRSRKALNEGRRYVEREGEPDCEPEPLGSFNIPHTNASEPRSSGSSEPFALALNADELAAVARMIEHNKTAAKPSKSSTIQAGFGVSRGGSQLYQRASMIYDSLFGQPEPAVETPIAGRRTHARFRRELEH